MTTESFGGKPKSKEEIIAEYKLNIERIEQALFRLKGENPVKSKDGTLLFAAGRDKFWIKQEEREGSGERWDNIVALENKKAQLLHQIEQLKKDK
jgi:hypothetical protein